MLPLLQGFDFTSLRLRQHQALFRQGDAVNFIFAVNSGEVHLVRRQKNGTAITLQRGRPGTILAEASLFVERYHCDAIAISSATVLAIGCAQIRRRFEKDAAFAKAWANHLAGEVRTARLHAEILACKTVAERLDLWLGQDGKLPEKGTWKDVAAVISTSPEALYRELARRKPSKQP